MTSPETPKAPTTKSDEIENVAKRVILERISKPFAFFGGGGGGGGAVFVEYLLRWNSWNDLMPMGRRSRSRDVLRIFRAKRADGRDTALIPTKGAEHFKKNILG